MLAKSRLSKEKTATNISSRSASYSYPTEYLNLCEVLHLNAMAFSSTYLYIGTFYVMIHVSRCAQKTRVANLKLHRWS